ncbi:MAG: DUF5132 domain-containing protein [Deltaproteobacteria bacterium]|nr:DUF5132 domain-containing protein [Deltaproteobacteria bacterium]
MKLPLLGEISVGTSLLVGVGAMLLVPFVLPVVGAVVRPVAKGVIKGGMLLYHRGEVMVAETKEAWDDLTAEVKAELAQEAMPEASEAAPKAVKTKPVKADA